MAKDKITEYDATANNNTVVGDVNLQESSMLPSDVNNAIREVMSHQKEAFGAGTPLYVDQTNNRVGVNKTPTVALDVSGDANLSGTLDVTGAFTSQGIDDNADATAITIDSSENVGIGTSSPTTKLDVDYQHTNTTVTSPANAALRLQNTNGGANNYFTALAFTTSTTGVGTDSVIASFSESAGNSALTFWTDTSNGMSEKMRIDSSGNLLVGKTASTSATVGCELSTTGRAMFTRSDGQPLLLNRTTSTGNLMEFRFNNVAKGILGTDGSSNMYFACERGAGIAVSDQELIPTNANGALTDNLMDCGHPSYRFDDVRATNGTIQTSDQQEKNTITDSDLGIDFIKRLTPKSYIFNGKTRTHYGLIAQDVETVLSDINKPTSGFAGFIKDDISEEQDGSQYRYGLRYTEFVAPLIQAVKDQQATIDALTARITALENGE